MQLSRINVQLTYTERTREFSIPEIYSIVCVYSMHFWKALQMLGLLKALLCRREWGKIKHSKS